MRDRLRYLRDEALLRLARLVYRAARPAYDWCNATFDAVRIRRALKRGDRVRLTGKCCTIGRDYAGALCTIMGYDDEAGDYRVIVDGKKYTDLDGNPRSYSAGGYDYACERGFEVVSRGAHA